MSESWEDEGFGGENEWSEESLVPDLEDDDPLALEEEDDSDWEEDEAENEQ